MVFGGGNAGSTQSCAEEVLAACTVNTLYAGGKSDIGAEGITVSVAGGTVSGTLFAGVL